MSTKTQTLGGIAAIITATLLWTGFARSIGPSASLPDWLNPPTEPAR